MIDHDRIFKELIKTFFVEFVELFLPDVYVDLDQSSIEFLDKEVFTDVTSGEKHEVDLIVKARFRDQDWFFLFHIEAQADNRAPFPRRMFTYFARLLEGHGLPVYPVVVFSYDAPLRPEPDSYRVEFPGFKVLEFNFRVIQLNRLNWRDFLNHQNPVASALMAKMAMKLEERRQVKLECLRLMLTLKLNPAKMQMIAGFVNTYLRLSEEGEKWLVSQLADLIPKETNMEWITPWHTVGMIEGRMEEALIILMRQLKRRFGLIKDEIETQVRALSLPQIEELSEAFLDFNTVDDLKQWLAEHSKNEKDQPIEPIATP
jgi:Domain of unknown function (DUF4351)